MAEGALPQQNQTWEQSSQVRQQEDQAEQTAQSSMPTSADGMPAMEIRTMRDDLARIRAGELPHARKEPAFVTPTPEFATPPPSLPLVPTAAEETPPPPPTVLEPPPTIPVAQTTEEEEGPEPFAPTSQAPPTLDPTDFDLLGHLESLMPQRENTTPPTPPELHRELPTTPSGGRFPSEHHAVPHEPMPEASSEAPATAGRDLPLRPEELLALEEEVAETMGTKRRLSLRLPRAALIAGGAAVIIALASGAYIALRKPAPKPASTPPSTTSTAPSEEPPPPNSLIAVAATDTITVPNINESAVALAQLFHETTPTNTLRRILVNLENETERRYLTFDELIEALGITMPADVYATLNTTQYTLFLYGEPTIGARVGLVVATHDAAALRSAATAWETNLPENLDALLRMLGDKGAPAKPSFSTTERRGLENRYLNFPEPTLSIDYTIDPQRNLLLIATSRATMYAAIDALP